MLQGHSAILSTFIKLPSVFQSSVLSIFEWPIKTGFTVYHIIIGPSINIAMFYIKYPIMQNEQMHAVAISNYGFAPLRTIIN